MHLMTIVDVLGQLAIFAMIGIYLIFSNTIMPALRSEARGAEVMIKINEVILNPTFYTLFFGSAGASIYLFFVKEGAEMLAGLVFFLGTFVVTLLKNVPLNNQLKDSPLTDDILQAWRIYLKKWVAWNHVRTLSAMSSGVLLLV